MTNQELFFQWLESQESVSYTDIITKLFDLGEIEEAKLQLNNLKNETLPTLFGERNAYDMVCNTLPKNIVESLVA